MMADTIVLMIIINEQSDPTLFLTILYRTMKDKNHINISFLPQVRSSLLNAGGEVLGQNMVLC